MSERYVLLIYVVVAMSGVIGALASICCTLEFVAKHQDSIKGFFKRMLFITYRAYRNNESKKVSHSKSSKAKVSKRKKRVLRNPYDKKLSALRAQEEIEKKAFIASLQEVREEGIEV